MCQHSHFHTSRGRSRHRAQRCQRQPDRFCAPAWAQARGCASIRPCTTAPQAYVRESSLRNIPDTALSSSSASHGLRAHQTVAQRTKVIPCLVTSGPSRADLGAHIPPLSPLPAPATHCHSHLPPPLHMLLSRLQNSGRFQVPKTWGFRSALTLEWREGSLGLRGKLPKLRP